MPYQACPPYSLVQKTDKNTCLHTRIIWSCCWMHDDKYFVTASRDKKVIAWGEGTENQGAWEAASKPLDVEEPATAVSVSPYRPKDTSLCPTMAVRRLRWNRHLLPPAEENNENFHLQLAACSNDSSLRILNIPVSMLGQLSKFM
eukprot:gene14028-5002_t